MSRVSVSDRPKTMSCRRLMGLASFATHLSTGQPDTIVLEERYDCTHSSRTEAGRHGGALWKDCNRGGVELLAIWGTEVLALWQR
jgi:hypothetical protein